MNVDKRLSATKHATATILVVDDDAGTRETLNALLYRDRYSILFAESGFDALQITKDRTIDLVLLDVMMPGMDGFEVCQRLRTSRHSSEVPILLVTALDDRDSCLMGLKSGADDFISKPFERDILLTRIRNFLRRRTAEKALKAAHDELEKKIEMRTTDLVRANLDLKNEIVKRYHIEEDRKRLVTAIEQADESIVLTDTEGLIQYANPAFAQITGYALDELKGMSVRTLKSGKQSNDFYAALWQTITQGRTWKGRFTNKRKNGDFYEEQATISPVLDASGTIVNFVKVARDITRELQLEKYFRDAQKMETLGGLASGIAHDFNNVLFAIDGYTKLARRYIPAGNQSIETLNRIDCVIKRATDLTAQILTFSRPEANNREHIRLQPLIDEALELIQGSLPPAVTVHRSLDPNCGPIFANDSQIHQIIVNLCTNAFQAMTPQGGTLEITLEEVDCGTLSGFDLKIQSGHFALLRVHDTGSGMDEMTRERIFDPYFTTKKKGEGTGLGLSIVHSIVKSHEGSIHVESEPGRGSTFYLYFPIFHPDGAIDSTIESFNNPTKEKQRKVI